MKSVAAAGIENKTMMMCSRCHKRPAVVFLSSTADQSASQGLCLVCAKELGIKPVNDLMEKYFYGGEPLEEYEIRLVHQFLLKLRDSRKKMGIFDRLRFRYCIFS